MIFYGVAYALKSIRTSKNILKFCSKPTSLLNKKQRQHSTAAKPSVNLFGSEKEIVIRHILLHWT